MSHLRSSSRRHPRLVPIALVVLLVLLLSGAAGHVLLLARAALVTCYSCHVLLVTCCSCHVLLLPRAALVTCCSGHVRLVPCSSCPVLLYSHIPLWPDALKSGHVAIFFCFVLLCCCPGYVFGV